ncbi:MAG TPA: hypothetical protein PLZ84_07850, partial [Clostridia bacterium]|nr:hypothetical protein [Clostridia bacterium]
MKQNKAIKIVILAIVFCIAVFSLAGCNGGTSNQTEEPTSSATVPSGNGGLDGREIRVLIAGEGPEPYKDRGQEGIKMTERIQEIEATHNCKIVFSSKSDYFDDIRQKFIVSIMTGKPNSDIALLDYYWIAQGAENGGYY